MTAEAPGAGPAPLSGTGPTAAFHAPARHLSASDIVMTETVCGVSVTKRVSGSRFVGVLVGDAETGNEQRISLLRQDGVAIPIGTVPECDTVAMWRQASRHFSLPMITAHETGVIKLEAMVGAVARGRAHPGRRVKALTQDRRPRFLTRRKTARLPLTPVVYRPSRAVRGTWLTDSCTRSITGHEMPAIC
jgi:hypothetical protein